MTVTVSARASMGVTGVELASDAASGRGIWQAPPLLHPVDPAGQSATVLHWPQVKFRRHTGCPAIVAQSGLAPGPPALATHSSQLFMATSQ